MKITSRREAKLQGLRWYFTGVPCSNGHIAKRSTLYCFCSECQCERGARYYANNKEKAKRIRASWREKNKEKDRADVAAYQAAHADKLKQAAARLRKAHPERSRASTAKHRKLHHADVLASASAWRKRNRDKVNAKKARRMASKLQATPKWASPFFMSEAYHLAKLRKQICGGDWHVDHIVPLRSPIVCGLHWEKNFAVIPGKTNQAKGNRQWPDMPIQ